MTDPLGRHWEQPTRDQIQIDDTHALMEKDAFWALHNYSTTMPTGVYPGKMWRAFRGGTWWLRWYGIVPGDETVCSCNEREILVEM